MRPIDADALKKEAMTFNLGSENYPCMEKMIYASDIEDTPTLDVVPVVHARWEDGRGDWDNIFGEYYLRNTYVCSACRVEEKRNSAYCPNCGAKMDLE